MQWAGEDRIQLGPGEEHGEAIGLDSSDLVQRRVDPAPQPPTGAPLKAYLRAHHHTTGFFVAAYPQATVGDVRAALAQREDAIAFARDAQSMDPAQLQAAFLARLGG